MRLLAAFAVSTAVAVLAPGAASATSSPAHVATANGTFTAYAPGAPAVTYRPDLVPAGARAHVFSLSASHELLVRQNPQERSGTTRMRTEYSASNASGVEKPAPA